MSRFRELTRSLCSICKRSFQDLRASGIGILITDHNVRETLSVTDRAYIINEGQDFPLRHARNSWAADPEVRRVYLGESFHSFRRVPIVPLVHRTCG